jgi:hypothetical protein
MITQRKFISPQRVYTKMVITLGRKYFNESRYPHGNTTAYTEAFAQEFLEHVTSVKSYIDDECNCLDIRQGA